MSIIQSGTFTTDNLNSLYVNLTAGTTTIKTGQGQLYGVTVNSHSSGTLKLYDSTDGITTPIHNTISFAAGERTINLFGVTFGTACTAVIGGTANITIAYR